MTPAWARYIDEWTVEVDGHEGHLMTVEAFKKSCDVGAFIDYDGMGDLIKEGKVVTPEPLQDGVPWPNWIRPSTRHEIPDDVTHVLWYNR